MTKLHWSFLMTAALIGCGDKEEADVDADGDGAFETVDCDDNNAAVYPGAAELCDGVDNDCDEAVDEDATDAAVYYADTDGDGYGSGAAQALCDGTGYVDNNDDCNDSSAEAYPGGAELCDGVDNDCNGTIDDGSDLTAFYADADGDGFGSAKDSLNACAAPSGYVSNDLDCNDYNDELNPDTRWYPDGDGDGFGSQYDFVTGCDQPSGYLDNNEDCDDGSAETYPGAVAEDKKACMIDADGDGFGDSTPNPGVDPGTDCYDDDNRIYPGNVAEDPTLCLQDFDEDGFGDSDPDFDGVDAGTDCDDANASSYPGAPETCDREDNDCNGIEDDDYAVDASTWYQDNDDDGYGSPFLSTSVACNEPSGYTDNNEDCDDGDEDISPEALEDCTDGIDNDCDGDTDEVCIYGTDSSDVIISGSNSSDYMGYLNAGVTGDLNADGEPDFVTGAWYHEVSTSAYSTGRTYVFTGPMSSGMELDADDDSTFAIDGSTAYMYFGVQVAVGDIDNDGYDDLVASAYGANSYRGQVFAFYGPVSGAVTTNDADFTLEGASTYNYYGYYSLDTYDYDGDGSEEIVAGSYAANSYRGILGIHSDPSDGDTYNDASTTVGGGSTYNYVGYSFEGTGDVDGDGNNDLLYGAYYTNYAYLIYGTGTAGNSFTSADADATFSGPSSSNTGTLVESGDFNDDGYVDVVIGSRYYSSYYGGLHYFYGPVSGSYSISTDSDAEILGETSEYLGYYDTSGEVGDVDNDGADDMFIGSYYNAGSGGYYGGAFLFYGALSGSHTLSDADVIVYPESTNYYGRTATLGDVDGDGGLDLIGNAYTGSSYGGETYILFNSNF